MGRQFSKLFLTAISAVVFGVAGVAFMPADAASVTYSYSGVVDEIGIDSTGQIAAAGITVGSTFTGSFEYDSNASPTSTTATQDDFSLINIVAEFDNGISLSSGANQEIAVINDTKDVFLSFAPQFVSSSFQYDPVSHYFELKLSDSTGSVFSSTDLPSTLNLSDFDGRQFLFWGANNKKGVTGTGRDRFSGTITSLTEISPVPLPPALPLFLTGLGGLGFFGWRRKHAIAA